MPEIQKIDGVPTPLPSTQNQKPVIQNIFVKLIDNSLVGRHDVNFTNDQQGFFHLDGTTYEVIRKSKDDDFATVINEHKIPGQPIKLYLDAHPLP